MSDELNKLVTEQKTLWEQFKTKNDEAIAEAKAFGAESAETKAAVDAMQKRFDEIEVAMKRVNLAAEESKAGTKDSPEAKAFGAYMRKGDRIGPDELKALSVDSDSNGGYLVAPQIAAGIIEKLILVSPIRQMATVETISKGDTLEIPAEGSTEFSAGWTSERGSRSSSTTATLRMVSIPTHEMYAMPPITQKLLDDAEFDVEGWLTRRVSDELAKLEGAAFVSGTGAGQPEGILTNGDVTAVNTGSAAALTFDGLMDLYHDLPTFYAQQAKWLMNRATMGKVRKLKDGNGDYFMVPNTAAEAGWMILGAGVTETPDMPNVSAGTYPIVFGDIKRAYSIVDRKGINVLRDPYSSKPNILFYTTKRVGGGVVLAEALRKQYVSA